MIIDYCTEGEVYDNDHLLENKFKLADRDSRRRYVTSGDSDEDSTGDYENVISFVGFIINEDNDVLVSFPKNFPIGNIEKDAAMIFELIASHSLKRPDMYMGKEFGKKFNSNYPFAPFFSIYNYYQTYGLFFEDKSFSKPYSGGKVNWKLTINKSNKFIINNGTNNSILDVPIYYIKKYYFSNFLTECMIFAIDYTLEKFKQFIPFQNTGRENNDFNFIEQKEYVLNILYALKQQHFKDSTLYLIDNLILFYQDLKQGGSYYFKHYTFSSIWEDMITKYLNQNYAGYDTTNNKIIFKSDSNQINFKKESFYPNEANTQHYISPDHYYIDNDIQLIFDAKYYTDLKGINYKQIAYHLFLSDHYKKYPKSDTKNRNTYSALLLPSKVYSNKVHFKMNPDFNKNNIIISEEYLNIRDVIVCYLGKKY